MGLLCRSAVEHNRGWHDAAMTFAELVAALQARLGQGVEVIVHRPGEQPRARQGALKPALDDRTQLVPDDDGRLVFRVVQSEWYVLDPRVITDAGADPDGLLRVEMGPTYALVVKTLASHS